MEKKKINIKKIIYILLIVVLAVIFVSSLVFGSIAAFTETLRDNIEVWYTTKFEKDISLLSPIDNLLSPLSSTFSTAYVY